MQQENQSLVQPQIEQITQQINESKEEIARLEAATEQEKRKQAEFTKRVLSIKEAQLSLEDEKVAQRSMLSKLQNDPDRIRKQASVVSKAADNLRHEMEQLRSKIEDREKDIKLKKEKESITKEALKDLEHKLELHHTTLEKREEDAAKVRKNVEYAKEDGVRLLAIKAELDIEKGAAKSNYKRLKDQLVRLNKEFEAKKRLLKKKKTISRSEAAEIPNFENTLKDLTHLKDQHESENKRLKKNLKELKQDVDIAIDDYLRKDSVEKDKKEQLESEGQEIKKLEREIAQFHAEEMLMNKQISTLTAQREIKARDASKAHQMQRETKEILKIKRLVILDLGKNYAETNNRLKEFSSLYDVVKKARNK